MATDSSRRPVLKLGVVDLGVETAVLPNGVTVDMAIIRHPGASAIVALDSDGSIAMLRQWRHAIGGYIREIPAGCRNVGEDGRQCAERELREEAGLIARRWDRLGTIVTSRVSATNESNCFSLETSHLPNVRSTRTR